MHPDDNLHEILRAQLEAVALPEYHREQQQTESVYRRKINYCSAQIGAGRLVPWMMGSATLMFFAMVFILFAHPVGSDLRTAILAITVLVGFACRYVLADEIRYFLAVRHFCNQCLARLHMQRELWK